MLFILGAPTGLLAADPVYDARGFDPNRAFFSQLPYEHIDPFTGNLLLTFTDLVLPGDAGFDLKIQRTYNSKEADPGICSEDSWAGIGWTLHFGRVFNWHSYDVTPPVIEIPDGSQHQTFHHIAAPSGCVSCFVTRDHWIYDKSTATLTLPNGTRYTFGHKPYRYAAGYATRIENTFTNAVTIDYLNNSFDPIGAISKLTQMVGGQSREVTFTTDASNQSVSSMTFQGRTWTYTQTNSTRWMQSLLTAVHPPIGAGWRYSYRIDTQNPYRFELTGLTTPNGGQIAYTYADQWFNLGSVHGVRARVVVRRVVGGRDIAAGTWSYQYSLGSWQNQTIITRPCNTETYTFMGLADYSSTLGSVWRIGLQVSRALSSGGVPLESEHLTWIASSPISSDDQYVGLHHDWAIYVPLLSARTVVRGSSIFDTTNKYATSNFNDYGRPEWIAESGSLNRRRAARSNTAFPTT
jgi:hypothetical protein